MTFCRNLRTALPIKTGFYRLKEDELQCYDNNIAGAPHSHRVYNAEVAAFCCFSSFAIGIYIISMYPQNLC